MAKQTKTDDVVVVANTTAPTASDFENATHRVNSDITKKDRLRRGLATEYSKESKTQIMIAPMYAAYFGKRMHVSVNGISISVPCDGRPYMIPDTFCAEAQARLRRVNEQMAKQKQFSSVADNYESSPGELQLY